MIAVITYDVLCSFISRGIIYGKSYDFIFVLSYKSFFRVLPHNSSSVSAVFHFKFPKVSIRKVSPVDY